MDLERCIKMMAVYTLGILKKVKHMEKELLSSSMALSIMEISIEMLHSPTMECSIQINSHIKDPLDITPLMEME